MEIKRIWEMPNSKTFKIECIKNFIISNLPKDKKIYVIDPFANEGSIKNHLPKNCDYVSNDIDESFECDYHLDALEFLKMQKDNSVDVVLFDPPYSPRQISECYKKLDKTVTALDTSSHFWARFKNEIIRITKENGLVFSFGWNSNGISKEYFDMIKILLVAHGSAHNDTICTLETKKSTLFDFMEEK